MALDIDYVVGETRKLVEISKSLSSNKRPEKSGGVLTIGINGLGDKYLLSVGSCLKEKWSRYRALSQEKATRVLESYRDLPKEIVSSWQTRQPETDRWGGAVLFPSKGIHIVSFSGLTEACDEALSLALGLGLGFEEEREAFARRVIEISKNPVYQEMAEKYFRAA